MLRPGAEKVRGRVLGLDLSLRSTGFGLVDWETEPNKALEYGTFSHGLGKDFGTCFLLTSQHLRGLIRNQKPEIVVYEAIEMIALVNWKNNRSKPHEVEYILKMIGALEALCDEIGIALESITPDSWRSQIRLSKSVGRDELKRLSVDLAAIYYGIKPGRLNDDSADALNLLRGWADRHFVNKYRQGRLFDASYSQ